MQVAKKSEAFEVHIFEGVDSQILARVSENGTVGIKPFPLTVNEVQIIITLLTQAAARAGSR